MRYFCLFFLFLISNALFCVGAPKRDRRPDAWGHTPVRMEEVRYSGGIGGDKHKRKPKRKPKRLSAKKIEKTKKIDMYFRNVVNGIGSIYLFPNKYEFQAVYDCLLENGATDIKCKELGMIFKKLYKGKSENMSLALVKINEKKFCMATCGEGTYELLPFCQRCFQVFKKLKTVFLGGICGCPSDKVVVGDVLLAQNYNFIKKIRIGDAEDRKPSPSCEVDLEDKKAIQVGSFYVYKKDCITTTIDLSLLDVVRKVLEDQGIPIYLGIDCSLDAFVDEKGFCSSVFGYLCAVKGGSIIFVNMEDGQIADQCVMHGCEFYAIRVVSDHAGYIPREIEEGGRKAACEKLGEVFNLILDYFSKEQIF